MIALAWLARLADIREHEVQCWDAVLFVGNAWILINLEPVQTVHFWSKVF